MSVVAVCEGAGSTGSTTTGLLLASALSASRQVVFAECDPSGGDVAAWAGWSETVGWSSAVASGDRSWVGVRSHVQRLPSGLNVLVAPTQAAQAAVVVRQAAARFAPMIASMSELLAVVDCGRVGGVPGPWVVAADLVIVLCRQAAGSEGATVARTDRTRECLELLQPCGVPVVTVVVGSRPYTPPDLSAGLGVPIEVVLADDPAGAGLVAGAWSLRSGAHRSALARSVRQLVTLVDDRLAADEPVTDGRVLGVAG